MKKIIYIILMFFLCSNVNAQWMEWVQRFTGPGNSDDESKSLAVDNLGNVYVTGESEDDFCTIKYNSSGVLQWKRTYNGTGNSFDGAAAIITDGSGNVYVTGSSNGLGTGYDYVTIKYSSAGIQQWEARYNGPGNGSDDPSSMAIDNAGNVFVTGRARDIGSVNKIATIKYNSSGNQEWIQLNGPTYPFTPKCYVKTDNSGNIYVAGTKSVGNFNLVLTKYNTAGVQQWEQSYNGPGNSTDFPYSLLTEESGNIYVTGTSTGSGSDLDFVTIKYNSSGVQQWVQRYNGPGNGSDEAYSIAKDFSGNVYITGTSKGLGSELDFATIKYNSSGVQQWVQRYNGSGNSYDGANSIVADSTGSVYVTGYSTVNDFGGDYTTIKYNSSGVQQWLQIYDGTGNAYDDAVAVALDNFNNIFITGLSTGIGSGIDFATIKYSNLPSPPLVLNSPNGSENYLEGTLQNITWSSTGINYIKIELTTNNSLTWSTISPSYPSASGSYAWTIPNVNSSQCKIKISEVGNSSTYDISNDNFTISPVTLSTGLIAYYPFNGNTNDESGNLNHGINYGATLTTDNNGIPNSAYDFNGSSNFVSIPDFNILNINNLTFSCVVYPRSLYNSVAVYHGYSGEIQMNTYNGNQLGVGVKLADNNWYYCNVNALQNNWYLLTGVWERGNSLKLYLNGQFLTQTPVPNYDLYEEHFHNSSIGAYSRFIYPSQAFPFNGKIDEVRFYNRALSQTEIQQLYSQTYIPIAVTKPVAYSKLISGETDTIRWINQGWTSYNIKCLLNFGTPSQSEFIIDSFITDTSYIWSIPETLLSFRSKIIIQNPDNINQSIASDVFRIKPYLLTKLNPDSTYYQYSIGRDNWKFRNGRENFWSEDWYNQFNYSWIDPFTGRFFPPKLFYGSRESDFPDWVSWVNAFSIGACYSNFDEGEYSRIALARWKAIKRRNAKYPGSCFGLALSNAMAFNFKSQFLRKYPDFPGFTNPNDVNINYNVRKLINELWTHQLGQPHFNFLINNSNNIFPSETLYSLKDLLLQDNCAIKMLGIRNMNNTKGGAHMILPYKVEKLFNPGEYSILTYDNNSPDVPISFLIKTQENGGNGSWSSVNYNNWGGAKGIILSDEIYNYFFTPELRQTNTTSPFAVDDSLIQIYNPGEADILIKDNLGNVSGTVNDSSFNNITNSVPVYYFGGFEGPPYMYNLNLGSYTVSLNNFKSDKIESFFFTGNKSYSYNREQISSNQTDKLFFDGNITASNEDFQTKQIGLSSIIKEDNGEKVILINSLNLNQNDSVKLLNIHNEDFKLISYGSQKQYNLELNYATPTGNERFVNSEIVLYANSSQIIKPEWENISYGNLTILEDIGNNGTIDDTINITNQSELNLILTVYIEGLYDKLINRMVPDTVSVLLRERVFPFAITDSARGVLGTKGKGFFNFHKAHHLSSYYIIVKHRNSIEVWSDSAIVLSGTNDNKYSFVDSASFAFGSNLLKVDSSPLSFALYSGDINQDGIIDGSDMSEVDNDAYNSVSGYLRTDINGDYFVDGEDLRIVDNNTYNAVTVIRP